MTNILALAEVTCDITIERDSDVVESLGYYDSSGNPVYVGDIVFNLTVRTSPTGPVLYYGSTITGELQSLQTSPTNKVQNTWVWVCYRSTFPAFLTAGKTYWFNVQAVADGRTRTVASGNMPVVAKGAP